MGRLSEQRTAELQRTLPPLAETHAKMRAFMASTDMSLEQFARLTGYAANTMEKFLYGRYAKAAGSDLIIREAIEDFISKHPVGTFQGNTNGRLYETENVAEIRRWFEYCHANQALGFVYGAPGSQKTVAFEKVVADFNRRELAAENSRNRAYYVYCSINISPRDIIRKICREVGAPSQCGIQRSMDALRYELRGTKTVIVLDEANHLSIPSLELVRELNDLSPHIGVLLGGSHDLKDFFDVNAARLEQWNSRLDFGVELAGVSEPCARAIITSELPELDEEQITDLITGSRMTDIYSRDRQRTYLSMRRIFKGIKAIRKLEAEAEGAAA